MPSAATQMDLEIIILSKVSKKEKDKYHDITYMWNLTKQKQTHQHGKQIYGYQKGKGGGKG